MTDLTLPTEEQLEGMRRKATERFKRGKEEKEEFLKKYRASLPPTDSRKFGKRVRRTNTAVKADRGDLIAIKGRKRIYSNDRLPAEN